ncbi:hypothetical protein GCM10028820_29440 [Tessaracoccus terricola]
MLVAPSAAKADPVTHSRTLTPLADGNDVITQIGTNRGRGMMRESLGISVDADAVIEARVTNGVADVVVALTTDDHQQDVQGTLPVDGSWKSLTANKASAVFVRSREWATAPQVEYRVASGTEHVTPEYNLGGSQSAFVAQWAGGASPFALVVDQAFTMLLPRVDLPKVQDMSWSDFADLDEVIESYRLLIGTYNQWLGIDDAHADPVHHDLPQGYFIRPDVNGPGLAYYGPNNAIGTNNESVSYYLQGPGSWLILHEVGHGYDGMMTGNNGPTDMHLGEVWNNVYAYLYQTTIAGQEASNWLYSNGRAAGQKGYDDARHATGGQDFNEINVRLRLDVLTRIAELTGVDGFVGFNRGLRELRADSGFSSWPSRNDLVAELWGQARGYDLLPWFSQFNLPVSADMEAGIVDHQRLPGVLPVGDYFDDRARAQAAATALGLDSPGRLVPTTDLLHLGHTGTLTVAADIADVSRVEGGAASLWTGTSLVGQAQFVDGVADFGTLPIGSYTLRFPQDAVTGTVPQRQAVRVADGEATAAAVTYPSTAAPSSVNGTRLVLQGLGNGNFAEVLHDAAAGEITITDGLGAPHTYFIGEEYAHVTVTSGGTTLFDRSFVGDAARPALERITTVPAAVGTTITVRHREYSTRLQETDGVTGAAKPSLNASSETTQYEVTEFGLVKVGGGADVEAEFETALTAALARLQQTASANPGARLEVAASALRNAVAQLTDATARADLLAQYGTLLDGLVRPATTAAVDLALATPLAAQAGQPSSNLFDGDLTTAFHSPWATAVTFPYEIDLDLGADPIELDSLVLVPHDPGGSGSSNGRPAQYRVLAGDDASSLAEVASGTFADDATAKVVPLQGRAKFVRLEIAGSYGTTPDKWVSARELQVFGQAPGALSVTMARTDTITSPGVGDVLTFDVTYTNNTATAVTVFPRSSNLSGTLTTGAPNCRYKSLGAGVTHTCTSASHTVTAADVAAGRFTPALVLDATSDHNGAAVLEAGFVASSATVVLG